jgi:nickel/cobalt exporter
VLGWIFAKQAEFYRQFSSLLRAAKADGSAAWNLFGLSFLYGIFHAAGPGHGKAVISSYIVANNETWTRGVVLSFASALIQALVAVVLVGMAAALLNATAAAMGRAVNVIEIVSYSLIIVIGVRLLWVKGRAFIALLHTLHRPTAVGAAVTPRDHDHAHHGRRSRTSVTLRCRCHPRRPRLLPYPHRSRSCNQTDDCRRCTSRVLSDSGHAHPVPFGR